MLYRLFESHHPGSEICVELPEILAVDKNAVVLHPREHAYEWKLEGGGELPDPLVAEMFLENGDCRMNRDCLARNPVFCVVGKSETRLLAGRGLGLIFDRNVQVTPDGLLQRILGGRPGLE